MKRVSKAVFPVGGLGIRFLPATKANPMEMLPIVDKPLIQFAVEEAVAAGITDLIFITGRNKRAIPDHLDKAYELETELTARGQTELLHMVRSIVPPHVNCLYLRQSQALGLGHALLCAQPAVNEETFVVILADDLIDAETGVTRQLVVRHDYNRCSLLGVQRPAPEASGLHGWVDGVAVDERLYRIRAFLGAQPDVLPTSALGIAGRFLFTARVFHHLRQAQTAATGAVDFNAALAGLATEQQVLALEFDGVRYDCGSKLGYLRAVVDHALKRPELGADLTLYVKRRFCAGSPDTTTAAPAPSSGECRAAGED